MKLAPTPKTTSRRRLNLAVVIAMVVSTLALPGSLFADREVAHKATAERRAASDEATPEPIVVLAASSMTQTLPSIGQSWREDAGQSIEFSFAASSRLARQVIDGAPGDVFVSANPQWMQALADKGLVVVDTRRQILSNELVWVVPASDGRTPSSPAEVDPTGIEHLALAGSSVPAGQYADAALEATGLTESLAERVVRANNVRGALEWVTRGEADAGVVYRTDARARPGVAIAFAFEPSTHPPITYEAAVLTSSRRPKAAAAFLESLQEPDARAVFERAGFSPLMHPRVDAEQAPAGEPAPIDVWSAIRLSLLVGLWCALLGLVPAVGLGWLLARREFRGKSLVSTLVLAPLALPPVVTGFLLLRVFGRQGILGGPLAALGLDVPFSMIGAVIAAFVVGLPMYVLSARNAFEAVDREFEEVSLTMGHAPRKTFFRVTLPLAAPGLAAGAVLMFARAIGEFGATTVLAGNFEGETRTIALAVYTLLESPSGADAIRVLVVASLVLSFLAMLGYERLSRWQRGRGEVADGR